MTDVPLKAVIRCIRTLAPGRADEPDDGELLKVFAASHSPMAFESIVRRHGPLVMAVCRRVLGHRQDAEDAFQTTFLLLARNPAAVRRPGALAAWLHATASHVARNALRASARRRRHEGGAAPPGATPPDHLIAWREVEAIVHEEVDRLPTTYRVPFVLCCLDGRDGGAAARELGIKEPTLRGRVAEARRLLRRALDRRGVSLSAVLAVAAVTSRGFAASVPPALVAATALAAVSLAAGEPSAGIASESVVALIKRAATKMIITKTRSIVLLILAAGAAAAGVALMANQRSVRPADPPPPGPRAEPPATAVPPLRAAASDERDAPVELRGTVLGPDGKSVPGARVYLLRGTPALEQDLGVGRAWPAPQVRAVAGGAGEFRFAVPAADLRGPYPAALAALWPAEDGSPGECGIAWEAAGAFAPAAAPGGPAPVLRLVRDDVLLVGRVVDAGGRPVGGVDVRVAQVKRVRGEDLSAYLKAVTDGNADWDKANIEFATGSVGTNAIREHELSQLLRATTGADGRFTLRGVGRERIAYLEVGGAAVATERIFALTRPGPTVKIRHIYHNMSEDFPHYGSTFEFVAKPSVPVEGTVRAQDTGKPLAGVVVLGGVDALGPDSARAVTDAGGRYRLTGLPAGAGRVLLAVALDDPYLPAKAEAPAPERGAVKAVDFTLKRGVWVRGRVTDARTGAAVRAGVQYFAPASNPHVQGLAGFDGAVSPVPIHRTDKDGRYAIPGLPGRGIVAVVALNNYHDYPLGAGGDALDGAQGKGALAWFDTVPARLSALQYHSLTGVTVPDKIEAAEIDVRLDPGDTLVGTVLAPDGKPLEGATLCGGLPMDMFYLPLAAADFRVKQYWPDRPRLLLVYQPANKLAGSLVVRGPQPKPLAVKLEPCGAAVGRVVDGAGKPLAGVTLTGPNILTEGDDPATAPALPERYYTTDREGGFRVEGLAPGVKYRLAFPGMGAKPLAEVTTKSGETKDLGDFVKSE